MQKQCIVILFSVLLCVSSWVQDSKLLAMASPKLRQFLVEHQAASKALTNIIADAFAGKEVWLYYFYSDDESQPRAFHSYPTRSQVCITIRENQQPWDEFICLIYEAINSKNENQLQDLTLRAQAGSISKTNFSRQILLTEFEAVKKTREVLISLNASKKEVSKSSDYSRFIECPDNFDRFLSYIKKVSPTRDAIKEYELKYNWLRKATPFAKPTDQ